MGLITDLLKELPLSAVQRERAALEESKLQGRISELEAQVLHLDGQKRDLQAQLAEVQGEKNVLSQELKKLRPHDDRLPEERERVLRVVCFHDGLSDERIAKIADVPVQVTTWHLESLQALRFVSVLHTTANAWNSESGHAEWSIQPKGRDYLASHGMLIAP